MGAGRSEQRWVRAGAAVAWTALFLCIGACSREKATGLPEGGPVGIEILDVGLDGYVDYSDATVVRLRVANLGEAGRVTLGVVKVSKIKDVEIIEPPLSHERYQMFGKPLRLKEAEIWDGLWVFPAYPTPLGAASTWFEAVARDQNGALLGRAKLPAGKTGTEVMPAAVLAEDLETVKPLVNALQWFKPPRPHRFRDRYPGGDGADRLTVAVVGPYVPTMWYEYRPVGAVFLARPWKSLPEEGKHALRRWVSVGGRLAIVPPYCPDQAEIPRGTEPDESGLGKSYGAGRVLEASAIEEDNPGEEGDAFQNWLSQPGAVSILDHRGFGGDGGTWRSSESPLTQRFGLPAVWMLSVFVLGIIVVLGPVAHLALARKKKRELAWVVVPFLSLAIALATYVITLAVKGSGTAVESHQIVRMFAGVEDATATGSIRVLSAANRVFSLVMKAREPFGTGAWSGFYFPGQSDIAAVDVTPDSIVYEDVVVRSWGVRDFSARYFARPVPLGIEIRESGIRVTNTGPGRLTDVIVYSGIGWLGGARALEPGESTQIEYGENGKGVAACNLDVAWEPDGGRDALKRLLQSVQPVRDGGITTTVAVAARCRAEETMEVVLDPPPDRRLSATTCVWDTGLPSWKEGRWP